MQDMLLVYTTCKSVEEAKKIGKHLLDKHLIACTNIFPEMHPQFFWPPKSNQLDEGDEVVLLAKTLESKYQEVETEIKKVHSYDVPCILAVPVVHVSKEYYDWMKGEVNG